jgi:hypothetical protein
VKRFDLRLIVAEAIVLYWLGGVLAACALLAAFAQRIPRAVVAAGLVLCAAGVFAVRLRHEGPYAVPRGFDLAAVEANLFLASLILLFGGRARRRESCRPSSLSAMGS